MPTETNHNRLTLQSVSARRVEVDREQGLIRNVAVLTAGVTRPSGNDHDPFDIDGVTLRQVRDAINMSEIGVKSRMTHPELDGLDELPARLGYVRNARLEDGVVRADMHFHNPDSNDAITLMDIAEKDPSSAGLSIADEDPVFERSDSSETGVVLRVETIDAVDWTGTPAGNPAGMLSASNGNRNVYLQEGKVMNDKQREYLHSIGLPIDATEEQIANFIESLSEDQKSQFNSLKDSEEVESAANEAEQEGGGSGGGNGDGDGVAAQEDEEEEEENREGMTASQQRQGGGGVALTQDQIDQRIKEERRAERQRQKEVRSIALRCGYGEDWISKHIDNETSIDEVRRVALDNLKREPNDMPTSQVKVGSDRNVDTLNQAVQDAILLRAGQRRFVKFDESGGICLSANDQPETRDPHERAREFRGHSLLEMGRRYLIALGYREADNMQRPQLAKLLMSRMDLQNSLGGGVYMAHATGDFPELLADSMGKVLRQEYALQPTTWQFWARQVTAPDFKEQKRLQLSEAGDLQAIPEGDEYHYVGLTESKQTWQLTKYGVGLHFTREMLINDDLSAFDRAPRMLGRSAARKVETQAIGVLTGNQLADGTTLFSSGNGNATSGSLSSSNFVSSLSSARSAMRTQTALGSDDPLDLTPSFLLVPEAISTQAMQGVSSTVDPSASNQTPNPFQNQMQVIPSARLDNDSTDQWYLIASPNEIDTVEIGFLEGEETPVVEEEDEFDTDARKIKLRHQIAAAAIDHRGMVRSDGTDS